MSRFEGQPRLGDDARFELAMRAAGRARRNRPTALLVASAAAFVVALAAAAWGFSTRASARSAFVREQSDRAQIERLSAELTQLEERQRQAADAGAMRPIPDLYSRLEALATRAGMKSRPAPPQPVPSARPGGITVTEYLYRDVRDPYLGSLLEWLRLAVTEIPGLELYGLTIKPEPNNWNLDVTFRRVERTGS